MLKRGSNAIRVAVALALVAMALWPQPAYAATLFEDTFTRSNNTTVGNSWSETDGGTAEAQILSNRLDFNAIDNANQPLVYHTFTKQTSGKIKWTFIFNFERTGGENTYEVWMQLGDGLTGAPSGDTSGVAVNLKWGGTNNGFSAHEGFGYYDGASVTQVAVVSGDAGANTGGDATIKVIADLDNNTFDLWITGTGLISGTGTANDVAFDNTTVDIDTVMIYLDGVNSSNFGDLEIDNVKIEELLWDSYSDSGHNTPSDDFDDFDTENIVYMYGTGFDASTAYRVIFWDGGGSNREIEDPTSDGSGNLSAAHTFVDGDATGSWQVAVYNDTSYSPGSYNASDSKLVASDTSYTSNTAFNLDAAAIPEFPTILAAIAVAGMCFGLYYWMRKRVRRVRGVC